MFEAAQEIVRGPAARRAGVRYLEHETTEFVCRGRKWKVYGSPVSINNVFVQTQSVQSSRLGSARIFRRRIPIRLSSDG